MKNDIMITLYRLTITTSSESFTFLSDLAGFSDLTKIRDTHELNPEFTGSKVELFTVELDDAMKLLGNEY